MNNPVTIQYEIALTSNCYCNLQSGIGGKIYLSLLTFERSCLIRQSPSSLPAVLVVPHVLPVLVLAVHRGDDFVDVFSGVVLDVGDVVVLLVDVHVSGTDGEGRRLDHLVLKIVQCLVTIL